MSVVWSPPSFRLLKLTPSSPDRQTPPSVAQYTIVGAGGGEVKKPQAWVSECRPASWVKFCPESVDRPCPTQPRKRTSFAPSPGDAGSTPSARQNPAWVVPRALIPEAACWDQVRPWSVLANSPTGSRALVLPAIAT